MYSPIPLNDKLRSLNDEIFKKKHFKWRFLSCISLLKFSEISLKVLKYDKSKKHFLPLTKNKLNKEKQRDGSVLEHIQSNMYALYMSLQ